jgi:hypothetical protein
VGWSNTGWVQANGWYRNKPSGGGSIVPAYVQGLTHENGGTASTTVATTLASTVGVGNAVFVFFFITSPTATVTNVTDDKGNTYTAVGAQTDVNVASRTFTYYALNVSNSPKTITATYSTSLPFSGMLVDEYSGIAAVSALDGNGSLSQKGLGTSGANDIKSNAFTTTANGDLIWGASVNISGSAGFTAGTGFTLRTNSADLIYQSESQVQTTAGSIAATFGNADSVNEEFNTMMMAFKHA